MKKILSLLLSVLMCSTMLAIDFPVYALSQSGKCGDGILYSFNELTGELIIGGEGEIWDFNNENGYYSPFNNETSIKKVVIEEGVTGIGDYTFSGCTGITEINLPDSLGYLGEYGFENCGSITNIVIPEGVMRIYDGTFCGCTALTSITIPASVKTIYKYPFEGCSSLNTVFYGGSENDWNGIMINNYTNELLTANLVYCVHNSYSQIKVIAPTYASNGYTIYKCLICGTHFKSDITEQLVLPFNTETSSAGNKTYIIDLKQSGYLTYDFVGEGTMNNLKRIDIYDEDGLCVDTRLPEYNSFFKKCYLKDTVTLLAGKYYVKVNWYDKIEYSEDSFKFSLAFQPINETYIKTKSNLYYDAATAISIGLNKSYNGFLCNEYRADNSVYMFEIPENITPTKVKLSVFAKNSNDYYICGKVYILNELGKLINDFGVVEFYNGVSPSKTAYLNSGKYYIVLSKEIDSFPIEYILTVQCEDLCNKHNFTAAVITKKPTPTATGVKTYTCTMCGAIKTETIAKCAKYANPIKASGKTKNVKYSTLKKKNVTVARKDIITVSKAQGKINYMKTSGNKKITVSSSGKITVKKGLKKGTYKVKVKVTAAGNSTYKSGSKTVKVTIKVK